MIFFILYFLFKLNSIHSHSIPLYGKELHKFWLKSHFVFYERKSHQFDMTWWRWSVNYSFNLFLIETESREWFKCERNAVRRIMFLLTDTAGLWCIGSDAQVGRLWLGRRFWGEQYAVRDQTVPYASYCLQLQVEILKFLNILLL